MEIVSRGFRISYISSGSGPPLVLIPGLLQSSARWLAVGYISEFASHYRVLAVDLLGQGESDKPHDAEAYRIEELANDIAAVLDSEGIGQAHIWGYSLGGQIACVFATRYPERVLSLIVGGSTVQNVPQVPAVAEWRKQQADSLRRGDWDAYWKLFGALQDPAIRSLMEKTNDPVAVGATIEGAVVPQPSIDLSRVNAPIFVYAGSLEPAFALMSAGAEACSATFEVIAEKDHPGAFLAIDLVAPIVRRHLELTTTDAVSERA